MLQKLTAEQILEIVEANYSVSAFANGDWIELENESPFAYSKELQKLIDDSEAAHQAYICNKTEELLQKWYAFESTTERQGKEILQHLGRGEIEEVDKYGGEGKGDEWYSIKHFKDHDVYIRTDGYYQSHNGTEFEQGYGQEVKPVEKTITVYE